MNKEECHLPPSSLRTSLTSSSLLSRPSSFSSSFACYEPLPQCCHIPSLPQNKYHTPFSLSFLPPTVLRTVCLLYFIQFIFSDFCCFSAFLLLILIITIHKNPLISLTYLSVSLLQPIFTALFSTSLQCYSS